MSTSTTKTAMTFSMSQQTAKEINAIAKREQRSKSAVFDDMYRSYMFNSAFSGIQAASRGIVLRLGLETDDDIVDYAYDRGRFAKKHAAKT